MGRHKKIERKKELQRKRTGPPASIERCGQIFEEWQTSFEDKELECPVCGGLATK
ncbi:hypothetical protein ADUPG1_002441, partial [Aduncisulcus paluster]